jgi:hypothetical protein
LMSWAASKAVFCSVRIASMPAALETPKGLRLHEAFPNYGPAVDR